MLFQKETKNPCQLGKLRILNMDSPSPYSLRCYMQRAMKLSRALSSHRTHKTHFSPPCFVFFSIVLHFTSLFKPPKTAAKFPASNNSNLSNPIIQSTEHNFCCFCGQLALSVPARRHAECIIIQKMEHTL
jgi:hypothetical protein